MIKFHLIHIPKTGGRFVKHWFSALDILDQTPLDHYTFNDAEISKNAIPFAIVRNPYHRVQSMWNMEKQPEFTEFCQQLKDHWIGSQIEYTDGLDNIIKFEPNLITQVKKFVSLYGMDLSKEQLSQPIKLDLDEQEESHRKSPAPWTKMSLSIVNNLYREEFIKFNYSMRDPNDDSIY
mgnify:CR=1 FL=1